MVEDAMIPDAGELWWGAVNNKQELRKVEVSKYKAEPTAEP